MTYLREAPSTFPGAGLPRSPAKARSTPKRGQTKAKAKSKPRKAKAKPPCKYGPRDADGYCPKKPKAAKPYDWEADLPEAPAPAAKAKPKKPTKAEAAARRRFESAVERQVRGAITKGGTKVLKSKTAARAADQAARAGRYLGTSVTALSGAGAAGAVGLAIAAGVGAFMATSRILKAIRDRKERAQQAAFAAAQGMRQTRLDAEARLGRPLTKAELGKIRDAFDLTNLMRKAGL